MEAHAYFRVLLENTDKLPISLAATVQTAAIPALTTPPTNATPARHSTPPITS